MPPRKHWVGRSRQVQRLKEGLSKAGREWCKCDQATDEQRFRTVHNPGRPKAIERPSQGTFLSLKVAAICEQISNRSLQLNTRRGRRFDDEREEINRRNLEVDARNLQIVEASKAEARRKRYELQQRAKEEKVQQNLKFQAAQTGANIAFLTLRYGCPLAPRNTHEPEIRQSLSTKELSLDKAIAIQNSTKEATRPRRHLLLPPTERDSGPTFSSRSRPRPTHQHFKHSGHITTTTPAFSSLTASTDPFARAPLTPTDSDISRCHSFDYVSPEPAPNSESIMNSRHGISIPDADTGASIRDVIYDVHNIQSRLHAFRPENSDGLHDQIAKTASDLTKVHDKAADPSNPLNDVRIAQEIIDYVDDGRNPDIYTRDFVDLVLRGNAVMNGKQKAMRDFSKIFAEKLKDSFEGMDGEVDMIMGNAGMEFRDGKFVERKGGMGNGNAAGSR